LPRKNGSTIILYSGASHHYTKALSLISCAVAYNNGIQLQKIPAVM